jgi:hypothetical protein
MRQKMARKTRKGGGEDEAVPKWKVPKWKENKLASYPLAAGLITFN